MIFRIVDAGSRSYVVATAMTATISIAVSDMLTLITTAMPSGNCMSQATTNTTNTASERKQTNCNSHCSDNTRHRSHKHDNSSGQHYWTEQVDLVPARPCTLNPELRNPEDRMKTLSNPVEAVKTFETPYHTETHKNP